MKAEKAFFAAVVAGFVAVMVPSLCAQEILGSEKVISGPVFTGTIISVDKEKALMVFQSAETQRPAAVRGMNRVRIETSSGRRTTFDDVEPGLPVTVYYTPIRGKFYVQRVRIPETEAMATPTYVPPMQGEIRGIKRVRSGPSMSNRH